MEKKWEMLPEPNPEIVSGLQESININPILGKVLAQRGVKSFDEARNYFNPELSSLHDPFLMKGMAKSVSRICKAIEAGDKILIYGDYDVDGTTSVALVHGYLQTLTSNLLYYLPDRYAEGYGISEQGINYAIDNGVKVMVALDCGIRAVNTIALAADAGIDVIVCDHHIPGNELPNAFAILDPKQSDCGYPFDELSGCGVGFKLLQGINSELNLGFNKLQAGLDLVAVSICADLVPMIDENRVLAFHGLQKLNQRPNPGLLALIKSAKLDGQIDVAGVVFGIAPRINAAGRIRHATAAVQLLLSEHDEESEDLASEIQKHNQERRSLDKEITIEAMEAMKANENLDTLSSTVVFNPNWHKGVIGIVASRLVEEFYKPTIVLTQSNGKVTGSARSVEGFNIYEALLKCETTLEQFGGHAYAAGLSLDIDKLSQFTESFEAAVKQLITDDQRVPRIQIDTQLDFDWINPKFFAVLSRMAPFGPMNQSPVFIAHDVQCVALNVLKGEHLKMRLKQAGSKKIHEAIGFGLSDKQQSIANGQPFDIVYHLESNEWNGETSIQVVVKDIKTKKENASNT